MASVNYEQDDTNDHGSLAVDADDDASSKHVYPKEEMILKDGKGIEEPWYSKIVVILKVIIEKTPLGRKPLNFHLSINLN